MDNDSNDSGSGDYILSGMEKPCKLFICIDSEGYLTDSVAISDVANFDCYETIVDSAKRIISLFSKCQPSDVCINAMFYYKKRNRSTRMNPSPLMTTTDVFRAVAEHPKGEVPIGVQWMTKVKPAGSVVVTKTNNEKTAISKLSTANAATNTSVRESPDITDEPEKKKRKLDPTNKYKTYMPKSTTEVTTAISNLIHTTVSDTKPVEIWVKPKTTTVHMKDAMMKETSLEKLDLLKKGSSTNKSSKVNYQWKENVSCEVLLNYDGVTERRKLTPDMTEKVQKIIKGQGGSIIAGLQNEYISCDNLGAKAQELLNDANMNHPTPKSDRKPIKSLMTAKQEIFNILSVLQLSKARFKQLMEWMRSLKLEEGNQGKFYLSERNVIGHGLQINYDTDEHAARRLLQIHKSRLKSNQSKIYYPTSAIPPSAYTAVSGSSDLTKSGQSQPGQSQPGQVQSGQLQSGQIMLMVPRSGVNAVTSGGNVVTTISNNGHTQSLIPLTVLNPVDKGTNSDRAQTKVKPSGMTPSPSMLKKVTRVPNILNRSKSPATSTQSVPGKEPVPVPMCLFKSINNSDMKSGVSSDTDERIDDDPTLPVMIKQEIVDDDNCVDSSVDTVDNILNDDRLSMAVDHPELDMKLVIKTEPIDDFGD
ncbi:hypothetical protein ACF0H5_007932 [Mactra antiquata]